MGSFPIILLFLGVLTAGGVLLWVRQREKEDALRGIDSTMEDDPTAAVLVITENGMLLHANPLLREWMNANGGDIDLEDVRRFAEPEDHFLDVLSTGTRTAFQFGNRWVAAESYAVPSASETHQRVVVLRELSEQPHEGNGHAPTMDVSAIIAVINEINETVDASMGVEPALQVLLEVVNKALPSDAGEICIWDAQEQYLYQRSWLGDTKYLLDVNVRGGGYKPGEGVAGWMAKHKKPMRIAGVNDPVNIQSLMSDTPYRCAVGVPLYDGTAFIGTLTLFSHTPQHYRPEDVTLLQAVSKAASTVIRNAEHYAQQEARISDMAQLQELADTSQESAEAERIYTLLNERMASLLSAEMCGVLLYDENRQALVPQLPFHGLPTHVADKIVIPLPPGSPQRDIWAQHPYWVSNDLQEEPLVQALGLDSIADAAGIHNTAMFPLQIAGNRIGVLAISNRRGGTGLSLQDVQRLRVLASQAAIVVQNVRLYQRERRIDSELLGLQEMTHAIGALNHEQEGEVYQEITARIAHLMRSEMCGVLLYEPTKSALVARLPFAGFDDDSLLRDYQIDLPANSVMEQIWQDDETWYSNRVQTDSLVFVAGLEALAEELGVHKTLVAKMSAGGKQIGVVQIANPVDGRDYAAKDVQLLQIFAAQAGAIIENARLLQEVRKGARQSERLRRIAELASKVMTTNESFTPVLGAIAELLHSKLVFINVVDHDTNSLVTYPRWTYGLDNITSPLLQDLAQPGYEFIPARSGRAFISHDVANDERVLAGYRRLATRFGIHSAIIVPLRVGTTLLGEVGVANPEDDTAAYQQSDVETLRTVATQIASSIERLLIYERTGQDLSRRTEELDSIARISNQLVLTHKLDTILEMIRDEATKTTRADATTILLLHPAEDRDHAEHLEIDRRIGHLNGEALVAPLERESIAHSADPLLVRDYAHEAFAPVPRRARSAAAVAILYADQVVGVIHAYSSEPNTFDEQAAGFLTTLAAKASLAYQNDRLYRQQMERSERLNRRVDQLNRIFELGQMIQTNTDTAMVMEAIAYSIQHSVGFDTVLMLLFDEDGRTLRRTAQAGIPLSTFRVTQERTLQRDELNALLQPEYRVEASESYFFPIERVEDWYKPGFEVLSTAYEGNRSLEPRGKRSWHDGDILLVSITGQGGDLLGLISLDRPFDNKRPQRATLEVLEIFAHQASTMMENTRLFRTSQRSAEQEAQLNDTLEAVAGTFDLRELTHALAIGLYQLVPFQRLTLVLVNEPTESFDYLTADVDETGDVHVTDSRQSTLERTALGRAIDDREERVYGVGDEEIKHYEDLRTWYAQGEQSTIILPLTSGGICLGALHVGSHRPGALQDGESHQLISRAAQLVAGSVQNARLFNQAVNLQVLNRSVVESIQQGIVVLDNSGHILSINQFMREAYGWDDEARGRDLFVYRPELSEYLKADLRAVLEEGEPRERIGQTSLDENSQMVVRNFYIYPLISREQISGAVLLVEDVTEQVKLEEAIETRANQLAALTEVSTRITASLERDEVTTLAMDEMGWIIPFDVMTMWRRNGSYMVLEGATGTPYEEDFRVRINKYPAINQLVESQRVVSITAPQPVPQVGLEGEEELLSWMGVPLVNQGHVVGMFTLGRKQSASYETRQEHHVAFAFASQVAIALANADLFEQTFERTNELGTLLEAAQATSLARNLNEVFRIVAELMFSALEMETCTIMIYDDVDGELVVKFNGSILGEDEHQPIAVDTSYKLSDYPAREQSLENREVVVIIDTEDEERQAPYPYELSEMRSVNEGARMLVPLVVRDLAIGLIQLGQRSNDEESITQQKVRLARALGTQVAVNIENARLDAEASTRFEELMTINTLSQSISSTLKLEDMLPILREQVPQITRAEELYLALYDRDRDRLTFPLAVRRTGEAFVIPPRPLGNDEVSYIIRRKHPLSLGADYFSPDELRRSMGIVNGEGDIQAYMGVPVRSGDEVLGVLAVRNLSRRRAFTVHDDRILSTVASQLGAAIQNARLFERVQEYAENQEKLVQKRTQQLRQRSEELEEERDRLDTLYQITSELARTLDMDQLMEQSLGMINKAIGADDGVILRNNPKTDSLMCEAWLNPNNLIFNFADNSRSHPAEGLANWLLRNEDIDDYVVVVDDLHEQDYWDERGRETNLRSAIAVILESSDEPMGVMVLLSEQVKAFTENHLKLLVPAANQVAASLNSADLYQLIQKQAARMGRLLRREQDEAQKSNAILETIADGVMLADKEGKIVVFNNAAERILGLQREEMEGQPVDKLAGVFGMSGERWTNLMQEWSQSAEQKTLSAEDLVQEQIELGDKFISASLSPVYTSGDFLGTLYVFRDVTRDIEADRSKAKFIENVSHEFRTPLTPVRGFIDLLLRSAADKLTEQELHMAHVIKSNADRLTVLVNDVLNISKLDSGEEGLHMSQVDLAELLNNTLRRIARLPENVAKDLTSEVDIAGDVPFIRGDREKLRQALYNIIDNAFKYTPAGGSIHLSVTRLDNGRDVQIQIADTGVGIPDEFKEAAWKRFERYEQHAVELDVAGTGLGLSLARDLIRLHNGDIWFDSEVGVGTTFFIRLPIEQPKYKTATLPISIVDNTESVAGD